MVINFIDYFAHKTVKAQLSSHLPYRGLKDFEVGGGGGGVRLQE